MFPPKPHDDEDMCEDMFRRLQSEHKNDLNKTHDEAPEEDETLI
jgi:hypothetical protein